MILFRFFDPTMDVALFIIFVLLLCGFCAYGVARMTSDALRSWRKIWRMSGSITAFIVTFLFFLATIIAAMWTVMLFGFHR